jgi:hypothetical protein
MKLAVVGNGIDLMTICYDPLLERMGLKVERNYSFEDGSLSKMHLQAASLGRLNFSSAASITADIVVMFAEAQEGLEELTNYLPDSGNWISLRYFPIYIAIQRLEVPKF